MRLLSTFGLALTGFLAITTSFSTSVYAANLYGTNNSETIYGTASADTIVAYAGNDTVYGGDGYDTIYGNAGTDILIGDQGSDQIYGGADSDTIYAYAGDSVRGEAGIDTVYLQNGSYNSCTARLTTGGIAVRCDYSVQAVNSGTTVLDKIYTPFSEYPTITRTGTYQVYRTSSNSRTTYTISVY